MMALIGPIQQEQNWPADTPASLPADTRESLLSDVVCNR